MVGRFLEFYKNSLEFIRNRYSDLRLQELAGDPRRYLSIAFTQQKNGLILRRLIKGKRVLIIGSGPSATELSRIPNDVLIFTCNAGVNLLASKNLGRKMDFYFCNAEKIIKKAVVDALRAVKTNVFMTTDIQAVEQLSILSNSCSRLMLYDQIHKNFSWSWAKKYGYISRKTVSTGLRLLQYALYFKASEIYIIGVDLGEGRYFWGQDKKQKHFGSDTNFIDAALRSHGRIYSLSPNSPLTHRLPQKSF